MVPCLLFLAAAGSAAEGPAGVPAYRWKAKAIYRFDYQKTIHLAPDEAGAGRTTEMSAVLILEIESEEDGGKAIGHLKLGSPRLALVHTGAPAVGTDAAPPVNRQELRMLEDILTEVRWRVELRPDGRLRVLAPPANWRSWMQKLEQSGHWPKYMAQHLQEMLDQNFLLDANTLDEELLPAFGPSPEPPPAAGLQALHPRREVSAGRKLPGGRVSLSVRRTALPEAATPHPMPILDSKDPPVTVKAAPVEMLSGEGVFDAELGLPDSLRESYRVELTCAFAGRELSRPVTVTYALRRLAPPLRGNGEEQGPAGGAP
jgi:hypothetical protein